MTTFTKGNSGELSEIRDFINMVFSMHKKPHDFGNLLPKLYEEGQQTEPYHYLAKEEEKIKAVVCALPFSLTNGKTRLPCAAIGSVSVHPYSRGKGYMKELMNWMQRDLKDRGVALSVLEGRRHRYQYYGYEPGGQKLEFRLIPDNFKHCRSFTNNFSIKLKPVDKDDKLLISDCLHLHNTQSLHAERSLDDFYKICTSWNSTLYAIWIEEHICGYLCAFEEQIYELVLEHEAMLFSCLEAYLAGSELKNLTVYVPSWNSERIQQISLFCERFSILQEDNYCILDYKAVLSFFLNLKAKSQRLNDGSISIKPEKSSALNIEIINNIVNVSEYTGDSFLELSREDAVNILFSPGAFLPGNKPQELSNLNWFPLPLSLSHLDKC